MTNPSVDASVPSACRQRLITGDAERLLFETMLVRFREQGLLTAKGRQRTDSTHVLATVTPDWLQSWVPAVWCDPYWQRCADDRLSPAKPARDILARQIGMDGHQRLWAIDDPATPAWLREVPAIQTLRQVWLQQFYASPDDQPMRWRHADDLPAAPLLISSP